LVTKARILQQLWAKFLIASGCLWWAKRRLRAEGAVVVLVFHRVLDETGYRKTFSQRENIVRERTFRKLVAHVAGRYESVSLQKAEPGTPCKKPRVAFTFDDGWGDNYGVAFPITREYRIPLVIFVACGLIGRNTPFWPERVIALLRSVQPPVEEAQITAMIESLKKCTPQEREQRLTSLSEQACEKGTSLELSNADGTLSWQEIVEMDEAGVQFGSHTQTHQILTRVQAETARQEVLESKAVLERALGKRCDAFSYPNGNWSPETRRLLAEAGFKVAGTMDLGAWTVSCDPLCIPRINVYEGKLVGLSGRFSPAMFEYTTFWKAWRATRIKPRPRVETQPVSAYGMTHRSREHVQ